MQALRIAESRPHRDDGRELVAVEDARAAGEEIDALHRRVLEHGGPVEQVVEDGDALPVEEGAGIGGPRAAHHQLAARERGTRDTRQERDDA